MTTKNIIKMAFCLIQTCLILMLFQSTMGFNLDLPSFVKHSGRPGSMFGFSVALHKSASGPYTSKWIIIGAPKDNNSQYQPEIFQPGAVHRCDIDADNNCRLMPFDSKPNSVNDRGDVVDDKSNQWLGATIASSSGDNGIVVACAPRYVFHTMNPKSKFRIEPVGTCFTSRNFSSFIEFSPCRTNYWGYHKQGSCQAGFSAGVNKKGDRLYIGAPGSWYWQGQAYSIDPDTRYPYKPQMYDEYGAGGQSYSYDVTQPKNRVYSTTQSGASDDDSYLGYSTITGDFDGDGEEDVALGMPRGSELLGKVTIYKWNMVNILNITGWQIGAYFGYSMCTTDVDGDGYDDLIIGAPMYNEPNNEGKYDVGRVYIMLQGKSPKEKFVKETFRDGINTKGRFGLALTTLGDINQDGFGDFAVGAPYDGPHGNGAVYVFHGSAEGPLVKPSQVIYAEDVIGQMPPRTFGFSLSGGIDLDGNLYPDLAVGAYDSAQVIVFKSRPVAVVDARTEFLSPSKLIRLDEKHCQTRRDGKDVPCTSFRSCWRYTGINLPGVLDFQVNWVLDSRKPTHPRMFFISDEGKNNRSSTIRLERGRTFCHNESVYLVDNIRDKLTPIEVELRYQLRNSQLEQPYVRVRRDILEPVIDQNREIIQRDSLHIQNNCGADNICVPDLRLEVKTVNKYLLGSRTPLQVEVLISNFGEDAFETSFYMTLPHDLDYKKIQAINDVRDTPITCAAPSSANNYTLKCDIGNPLPSGKVANFKVIMIPSAKAGMGSSYDFYMEANSTNREMEGSTFDNVIRTSIGIWVETELAIEGTSLPEFSHYKASDYKPPQNATHEKDLGPHVVHIYNIRNNGPSTIEEAVVFITFPFQTLNDDILMYLLNQPETDGNIVCDPNSNVNTLNLKLDQVLAGTSYLVSIGAVVQNSSRSIHLEQSSSGSFSSSSSSSYRPKILTEEEKRRLKEEERKESSGDASYEHRQRAMEAAAAAAAAARGSSHGSSSFSSSNQFSSSSHNNSHFGGASGMANGPASVVISSKNRTVSYNSDGTPIVVETSTEYIHNLERHPMQGTASNARYSQQQSSSGNSGGTSSGSWSRNSGGSSSGSSSGRSNGRWVEGSSGSSIGGQRQWKYPESEARAHIEVNQQQSSTGGQNIGSQQRTHQTGYQGGEQRGSNYRTQSSNVYNPAEVSYSRQAAAGRGFDDLQGATVDKFGNGQGFRAGTLDLGSLNRGNVDDQLRHNAEYSSGGRTGGSYGGSTYSQSSHIDPVNMQYSYQKKNPYYGTSDIDNEYYYDQNDKTEQNEYAPSSKNIYGNRRTKRETDDGTITLDSIAPCTKTKCATLRCVAKNLGNNEGAWVAIRTRLVAHTMERLALDVPLNVSTMAVSYVTQLPYIGEPKEEISKSRKLFYKAIPEPIPAPDIIPLWIVILSACAGATILLLLVYLLHKCGFFNRNRPTDGSQERQPLRNGYHGDEHL